MISGLVNTSLSANSGLNLGRKVFMNCRDQLNFHIHINKWVATSRGRKRRGRGEGEKKRLGWSVKSIALTFECQETQWTTGWDVDSSSLFL